MYLNGWCESSFSRHVLTTPLTQKAQIAQMDTTNPKTTRGCSETTGVSDTQDPKKYVFGLTLLGTTQEGFCPPGWLSSKFSVTGASGHFCVYFTPGSKIATQLPCCLFLVQECSKFCGSAGVWLLSAEKSSPTWQVGVDRHTYVKVSGFTQW